MELSKERKNEILGIFISVMAVLLGISIFSDSAGVVGHALEVSFKVAFGKGAYLFPFLFFIWGIALIRLHTVKVNSRLVGLMIIICTVLGFLHVLKVPHGEEFPMALDGKGGGLLGSTLAYFLRNFFDQVGAYVILSATGLIGLLFFFDILLINILTALKEKWESTLESIVDWFGNLKENIKNFKLFNRNKEKNEQLPDTQDSTALTEVNLEAAATEEKSKKKPEKRKKKRKKKKKKFNKKSKKKDKSSSSSKTKSKPKPKPKLKAIPKPDLSGPYQIPPLNLLESAPDNTDRVDPVNQSQLLEETLQNFGVKAKVVSVSHGPTITRYEVQPAPGVKVSKIVNLADDIALSMAATDVRIEAPIPGKAAVGVEVPRPGSALVKLKDILDSDQFSNSDSKLSLALGVDIAGNAVVADLSSMPHLLVAGATGSGKSVCINTLILSVMYKATPDEVKFLLVDPKKVEMTAYKKLPHLLAPVVTDSKKAASVLKMVVQEMENRYELFADTGTRGIEGYNKYMKKKRKELEKAQKEGEEQEKSANSYQPLPYIVVIIDELADLMMVAAKDVEDAICRLAQMARAAGIHLVIATQRPSVDVITGLIKANIPSRMSFAVSSQVDSRTILDSPGAEKLLGKGDMLFAPVGSNKPKRVQGAFVSTEEVRQVVNFTKQQQDPEYASVIQQAENGEIVIEQDEERDELYDEAVKIVVNSSASISMLQRRLRVGYTRAARMIDTMEEDGIVGPHAGSKPRDVLVSEEEAEEIIAQINDNKSKSLISKDLRDDQ